MSALKPECSATAVIAVGCSACSMSARSPPTNIDASPWTRAAVLGPNPGEQRAAQPGSHPRHRAAAHVQRHVSVMPTESMTTRRGIRRGGARPGGVTEAGSAGPGGLSDYRSIPESTRIRGSVIASIAYRSPSRPSPDAFTPP